MIGLDYKNLDLRKNQKIQILYSCLYLIKNNDSVELHYKKMQFKLVKI